MPELPTLLQRVHDPRPRPEACRYELEEILLLGIVMFATQCPSRRELDGLVQEPTFRANFQILLGRDGGAASAGGGADADAACAVTCGDNLNRVLELLDPAEPERVGAQFTQALNHRKVLRRLKYGGQLLVAVDATELFSRTTRHCPHCLTRTLSNGETQYYHTVLAAKVVTPIGLVLPVAFEFVENAAPNPSKQDCETKALHRLVKRLARLFPHTQLVLLGDGLYAQEPVIDLCERHGWSFIVTLQDGQLPTLQEQIRRARAGQRISSPTGAFRPTCDALTVTAPDHGLTRTVSWLTPLYYHGRPVHILELTETRPDGTYHNVWITDLKPTRANAHELAQTGRLRWKIENEGTNTQKHGGYHLDHCYGVGGHAWQNYYLLLQLGQALNDLYRLGDLPAKLTGDVRSCFDTLYRAVRRFAYLLMESLRNQRLRPDAGPDPGSIQIRLADPPYLFLLG